MPIFGHCKVSMGELFIGYVLICAEICLIDTYAYPITSMARKEFSNSRRAFSDLFKCLSVIRGFMRIISKMWSISFSSF